MPQVPFESRAVNHVALTSFCKRLFVAAGLDSDDAGLVVDTLVESDLRGISSHGVARIPHYLHRIQLGGINPKPHLTTTVLGPTSARVDGNHGLGQLAMCCAAETAIQLAKESGAAWVTVCNSSHCGALAYYGLKIADAGMIGLVFTHVDPMVVPYGAKKGLLWDQSYLHRRAAQPREPITVLRVRCASTWLPARPLGTPWPTPRAKAFPFRPAGQLTPMATKPRIPTGLRR